MATEKRLIDAIEQEMPYCPDSDYEIGYQNGLTMAKAIALKLDAAPVVRCKACKHMEMTPDNLRWCHAWDSINGMGDEGFCNYGERRTDDA